MTTKCCEVSLSSDNYLPFAIAQWLLAETAIILQSSFSATRNVDENQDIRRNLRLNYPKDPLRDNVNE